MFSSHFFFISSTSVLDFVSLFSFFYIIDSYMTECFLVIVVYLNGLSSCPCVFE